MWRPESEVGWVERRDVVMVGDGSRVDEGAVRFVYSL